MNTFSLSAVPVSEFKSTFINGRITSYGLLSDRVRMSLGAPLINVEIHDNRDSDILAVQTSKMKENILKLRE